LTLSSSRSDESSVSGREIRDQPPLGIEELRTDGHADLDVLPVRAVLLASAPVATAPRAQVLHAPKRRQVAQREIRQDDDVAPVPSVATVGTTLRHELLAAEAETPVASATGLGVDLRPIVEHGR